jgi:plastocyanin
MKSFQVLATVAAATLASAKTIRIDSGPSLMFKPDNITAEAGDMLEFHFYSKNHSVAQGDFANACMPVQMGGFFSGYVPVMGTSESVSCGITHTNPLIFHPIRLSLFGPRRFILTFIDNRRISSP